MAANMRDLSFKGTFRDYQARVLAGADEYLKDGRIHVVAAPGSGKTILGLELICRMGRPALVLSPTTTIRQQWGERISSFVPEGGDVSDYVSYDPRRPGLLTSITYQTLHAAFMGLIDHDEPAEDTDDDVADRDDDAIATTSGGAKVTAADFRGFDLVRAMKNAGVSTICLDEAHHLRSEWYKALVAFIERMGDVKVIALTATPPYDSSYTEWSRYQSLCGEIDEEIFVPELVAKKNLCPHQDYIYLTCPTESEASAIAEHRQRVELLCKTMRETRLATRALHAAKALPDWEPRLDVILSEDLAFGALLRAAREEGTAIPDDLVHLCDRAPKRIWNKSSASSGGIENLQRALQLMLDKPEVFSADISIETRRLLESCSLLNRGRVRLTGDGTSSKLLASSVGKLEGIRHIVRLESSSLGPSLRMLVLVDYIRKDLLGVIGDDAAEINTMGAVPILEVIRREVGGSQSIGLLSGQLVIVPTAKALEIGQLAVQMGSTCSFDQVGDSTFSQARISGGNKNKVAILTEAFRRGLLNILVGTAALLGEGWDSPCINTLILASFVGSFMLSNQMRGRAIRVDSSNPGKASNIWHLATVELPEGGSELARITGVDEDSPDLGPDWATLTRRFDCFMGPRYAEKGIQSGIQRIDIIKPPYTRQSIEAIDQEMERRALDRAGMVASWDAAMDSTVEPRVEQAVSAEVTKPPSYTMVFGVPVAVAAIVLILALRTLSTGLVAAGGSGSITNAIAAVVIAAVAAYAMVKGGTVLAKHLSPDKLCQEVAGAVFETLVETRKIRSRGATPTCQPEEGNTAARFSLLGASMREQSLYTRAMAEMLSPIENPKYLLVNSGPALGRQFLGRFITESYAVPESLSAKADAEVLRKHLSSRLGDFDLVYTRNVEGRKVLLQCRQKSYVNLNKKTLEFLDCL